MIKKVIAAMVGCGTMLTMVPVSAATTKSIVICPGAVYAMPEVKGQTSNTSVAKLRDGYLWGKSSGTCTIGNYKVTVRYPAGYKVSKKSGDFKDSVSLTVKPKSGYHFYWTRTDTFSSKEKATSTKAFTLTKHITNLKIAQVKKGKSLKMSDLNKGKGVDIYRYTVRKKPSYVIPSGLSASYGSKLGDVRLPSGFTWKNKNTVITNIGRGTYPATFTPSDKANYYSVDVQVPVNGTKATPNFEIPKGLSAKIGEKASEIKLPNRFTWENSDFAFTGAGNVVLKATYTPEDTLHYEPVKDIEISVNVEATPITDLKFKDENVQSFLYTGEAIKPEVVVKAGEEDLEEGKDYELIYKDNVKIGQGTIQVNGIGNYSGSLSRQFVIRRGEDVWFDALEKTAEEIKAAGLTYDGGASAKTLNSAKKRQKTYNCALYVSWAMQRAGYLPSGKTFWLNDKMHGTAISVMQNDPRFTITHPNKPLNKLTLSPGDICGFKINGYAAHTAVFEGLTSKGNKRWYSGGKGDSIDGNFGPLRHTYYEQNNDIVYTVIHFNRFN